MKRQMVTQLSRPIALEIVLTAESERARISSEAATLSRVGVDCRPLSRQTPPESDEPPNLRLSEWRGEDLDLRPSGYESYRFCPTGLYGPIELAVSRGVVGFEVSPRVHP
jgi:hypothetical protein